MVLVLSQGEPLGQTWVACDANLGQRDLTSSATSPHFAPPIVDLGNLVPVACEPKFPPYSSTLIPNALSRLYIPKCTQATAMGPSKIRLMVVRSYHSVPPSHYEVSMAVESGHEQDVFARKV